MTRTSIRQRALKLLAASMAFAACAPLPTTDSDPKPTTTNKKKASPSPSASASTAASASPSTSVSASPSPSPSASASVSPSPSPSASASASASPSPSPSPTPTPLTLASDEAGGRVYDDKGAMVASGKVRILSLSQTTSFDKTVDITNGLWKVGGVPASVNLSITATREGWTSRQRVKTLAGTNGLEVNFGGPATTRDAEGSSFFISDLPEIVSIEPADDQAAFANTHVALTVTLSEPFDATNQRRLADCLYIIPGDQAAAGDEGNVDTSFLDDDEQATVAAQPFKLTDAVYSINEDSTFLDDDESQAQVQWNELGTEMTLRFNAPVLANEDDPARYCVAMFSKGEAIRDKSGLNLGSDETGVFNTVPAAGELIYFAFREDAVQMPTGVSTPDKRWQTTHQNFADFTVPEDETDPTLTGVTVTTPTINGTLKTRISLSFSEPMAAYFGGSKGLMGLIDGVRQRSSDQLSADESSVFSFAVAETAGDLDDVEMAGFPEDTAAAPWGDTADEREMEFKLDIPQLTIHPDDPKVVRLEVTGQLFSDSVNAIKAYVEGLSDPAGNSITESSAAQNVKVGNI